MYEIITSPFGSFKQVIMQSSNGQSRCSVVPAFGANILGLELALNGKPHNILDGFKTAEQLTANDKSRSIHLVPFPNRVKDGTFAFDQVEYKLPINKLKENNAIHGFIWNKSFSILEEAVTSSAAILILTYHYSGEESGFPFPFKVQYRYELSTDRLSIAAAVQNTGSLPMPLGVGWHPYFTFQKPVDDLLLQLPQGELLLTDERLIPKGSQVPFDSFSSKRKIDRQQFDSAFHLTGPANQFVSKLSDPEGGVTIVLQQSACFKYLQVYIPPDRNSIALEPMTCPANAFNSGEGLIVLEPNESFSGEMIVSLAD